MPGRFPFLPIEASEQPRLVAAREPLTHEYKKMFGGASPPRAPFALAPQSAGVDDMQTAAEAAAARIRQSVRPEGGRREGPLTSLPEDLIVPKTPLDLALLVAGGPFGKLAKVGAMAAGAALSSDPAQAGPAGTVVKAGKGAVNTVRDWIRAYHGSAHDFDKFSASKIGAGEGAQAYGHSLYFAENPEVARSYREALSPPPTVTYRGEVVRPLDRRQNMTGEGVTPEMQAREHVRQLLTHGRDDLRGNPKAVLDYFNAGKPDPESTTDPILRAMKPEDWKVTPGGKMYEVDLKFDPEKLLQWDKPISEQPHILQVMRDAGFEDAPWPYSNKLLPKGGGTLFDLGGTGEDAYRALALLGRGSHDYETASKILKNGGIPGIRYYDQLSRFEPKIIELQNGKYYLDVRGNSVASGNGVFNSKAEAEAALNALPKPTSNYVVFDDSMIDIAKKYGIPGMLAAGATADELGLKDQPQ